LKRSAALYFLLLSLSCTAQWVPLQKELDIRYANDSIRSHFLVTDFRGVVWMGTNRGLLKVEGQNLSAAIHFSDILSTASAVDSTIWLGTETGAIYILNPRNGKIQSFFALSDSSSISGITCFNDSVLISTYGEGLFLISQNDTIHFNSQSGLSDNYVYNAEIYDDKIICATDRGIDIINIKSKSRIQHYETSITTAISVVDSIAIAGSHRYGLVSINLNDLANNRFIGKAENLKVNKITKGLGRIFALTSLGVFEYEKSAQTYIKKIFEKAGILDFVVLDEGVMLALCEDKSIELIDLRFSKITKDERNNYTALTSDNQKLYVAGSHGVYSVDIASGAEKLLLENDDNTVVVSMTVSENDLYLGTFNRGLLIYNFRSKSLLEIDSEQGLPDNNVLSMSLRADTLWFATLSGISALAPDMSITQYPNSGRMQSTYIYSVLALDTCILIGTDGKGLFNFKDNTFLEIPFAEKIRDETVYHISLDGNGNIWLNTKNRGLMKFQKDTGKLLSEFSDRNIEMMAAGGPGGSALAVGQGWIKLFYDNHSLLLENNESFGQISGDYLNNISYGGGENIFFAVKNRIYSYKPQNQFVPPRVYFESFQTNLQTTSFSESNLDADINHIVYSFNGIWYQEFENVKFRYRLLGIDEDWNETRGKTAVYPNLKFGTYTFEVETGLGNRYYSQTLQSHTFTISKPVYLRLWFIALAIFVVAGFVYLISNRQIKRAKSRFKSEQQRIESELAVLRNQVNPHFLFNSLNTLMNLIETDPSEAEEYLQRLSDFYRKILENKDDHVVSVETEIKNLEEYIYLQKKRFGDALNLLIDLDRNALMSKIPALTFQLLAENAIKHNVVSRTMPLTISVCSTVDCVLFANAKAPLSTRVEGTGIGLDNILSRYKLIFNKSIDIVDNEKEFTVKLPITH